MYAPHLLALETQNLANEREKSQTFAHKICSRIKFRTAKRSENVDNI